VRFQTRAPDFKGNHLLFERRDLRSILLACGVRFAERSIALDDERFQVVDVRRVALDGGVALDHQPLPLGNQRLEVPDVTRVLLLRDSFLPEQAVEPQDLAGVGFRALGLALVGVGEQRHARFFGG
jgi:hypothetical protein